MLHFILILTQMKHFILNKHIEVWFMVICYPQTNDAILQIYIFRLNSSLNFKMRILCQMERVVKKNCLWNMSAGAHWMCPVNNTHVTKKTVDGLHVSAFHIFTLVSNLLLSFYYDFTLDFIYSCMALENYNIT